ncbi:uncharacterized protein BJX67DRAFT_341764 [Aspergillus lucknowensis]|uniref:Aminotransferase-like plant mobile domain-containing protein n=1 Tax=Aspergillus lucknowensis TaxID=176173 RepID=A0ABR4M6J9_9EURO
MLYKIDCTAARQAAAARAEPVTPVFKMRRSKEEFRLARKILKEQALSSRDGNTGQVLTSEDALQYAHDMVNGAGPNVPGGSENDGDIEDGKTDDGYEGTSAITSDSSTIEEGDYEMVEEENKHRRRSDPPAYVVSHPWHIVDYHLYLCSAERGQTLEARREGMYVYDGVDCRRLTYDEFAEDRALMSQCFPGDQPQLLFGILPIANRRHFADRNPSFDGRHYVLGFDYDCKTLYARRFEWFPHDLSDIWCVWDHGSNVYTVTVPDLMHILETSLGKGEIHVGMGILSSSQYCLALDHSDDPGLEIIIATLWCQWLLDFSEILFKSNTGCLPKFQKTLASYVEQGRLILQRASYRAWFAVRDGYSKAQYKCKTTINQYTNDLYTFEKSAEDGSLKGRPWVAPGLETCNRIRHDERMQRRKKVEQRLEDLFVAPEPGAIESHDLVLQAILARTQQGPADLSAVSSADIPRTPSPKILEETPESPERCWSPGSPDIVSPAAERYDEFGVTAYHRVPLPIILEDAIKLVQAHPELDTFANRGRFGDLVADLSAAIRPDIQRWMAEGHLKQERPIPRLLPSPVLD